MCLLLWWHSVKHQQFYRDCLGGSSSRKEDLIACPAIQKKEIDFIIFGVSIIAKTNMLKCLTFWQLLAFGDRYSNYWYSYWASMSGSFQTLSSMCPKDPFSFQIIFSRLFRHLFLELGSWETQCIYKCWILIKMLALKQPFLHCQIILICTQIFIT